jgi:hypothetical protein
MQLCYRDWKDDATQLQDKGWRRSPARKLWHVLVEFVNGCSARKIALDSTGADFFDIDFLVRLHAQQYVVHHGKSCRSGHMVLAMASKPGRQKGVAGMYFKVRQNIGLSTAAESSHAAAGRANIIPAATHPFYFPHAIELEKLEGKDFFFGVFTSVDSNSLSNLLVGRCMLKIYHDIFHEQAIWPTTRNKDFVERVMKVDLAPGVPLYKFYDSYEKFVEAIKTIGKKSFGSMTSASIRNYVIPASTFYEKAAPIIRAFGSTEEIRAYYEAMEKWSKNQELEKPEPLPFNMVETVTWGDPPQPVASFIEERHDSVSGAALFKHCVNQAMCGYVAEPLLQHLCVLRDIWQKNRVTVARILRNPNFNGKVPTKDEAANCIIARSWSTKKKIEKVCASNMVLILAKKK